MKRCSSCLAVNDDKRTRCYDCGQLLDSENSAEENRNPRENSHDRISSQDPQQIIDQLVAEEKKMNQLKRNQQSGCFRPLRLLSGICSTAKSEHPIGWKISILVVSFLIILIIFFILFRSFSFAGLFFIVGIRDEKIESAPAVNLIE